MIRKTLIISTAILAVTMALPASDKIGSENQLLASIYSDCLKKESLSCIKYKVFSFVDKMLVDEKDITLTEGITVAKTMNIEEGAPRSIDSNDLETLLFDRLGRFLRTRTIKVDLKGSDILGAIESVGRSFDEGSDTAVEERGKKKKAQKMMGPILMAIAMKAAALIPLSLMFIALIAGKALLIGKVALVISTIIGLKKLFSGQKHVTYEVVQHPHHSSGHSSHDDGGHGGGGYSSGPSGGGDFGGYGGGSSGGHGGGWSRSFAQEMAYSAQKPQVPTTA